MSYFEVEVVELMVELSFLLCFLCFVFVVVVVVVLLVSCATAAEEKRKANAKADAAIVFITR